MRVGDALWFLADVVNRIVRGRVRIKEVLRQILSFSKLIESKVDPSSFKVLGPAPCLISKERGYYKWNFYLKGPTVLAITSILKDALKETKFQKAFLTIDVDPQ